PYSFVNLGGRYAALVRLLHRGFPRTDWRTLARYISDTKSADQHHSKVIAVLRRSINRVVNYGASQQRKPQQRADRPSAEKGTVSRRTLL
ncbi:hypothetical protein, partial [Bradyrhizobium sp. NBAIM08]|uniref:hypothetical protein n=1 Tax=Bradyrhizobium sp. NBAIM08 TaxID=2793815 RepID=UPI001CD5388F